ncbi:MAG: hypothetical protein ACTSRE_13335, partial [Promethearchaeota archaeon]
SRIKEMLGPLGLNNFSEAKEYLENKNPKEVLKDIKEKNKKKKSTEKSLDNTEEGAQINKKPETLEKSKENNSSKKQSGEKLEGKDKIRDKHNTQPSKEQPKEKTKEGKKGLKNPKTEKPTASKKEIPKEFQHMREKIKEKTINPLKPKDKSGIKGKDSKMKVSQRADPLKCRPPVSPATDNVKIINKKRVKEIPIDLDDVKENPKKKRLIIYDDLKFLYENNEKAIESKKNVDEDEDKSHEYNEGNW